MEYMNLKIHSLSDSFKSTCDKAIKDGVPEYAILLILEKTAKEYLQPKIQEKLQEELVAYEKEIKNAKPKGGPVTEMLGGNQNERN